MTIVKPSPPRACNHCSGNHRACAWVAGQKACKACHRKGISCVGGIRPRNAEEEALVAAKRVQTVAQRLNVRASSSRGRLNSLTLSYALSFHLISEYEIHIQKVFTILGLDLRPVFLRFKDVRGKTSELEELDELVATMCMASAAPLTSHSAALGDLARSAPSFGALQQFENPSDFPKYGLARQRLTLPLGERLLKMIDNVKLEETSGATFTTYLNVIYFGFIVLQQAGLSASVIQPIARQIIFRSKRGLSMTRFIAETESEKEEPPSLKVLTEVDTNMCLELHLQPLRLTAGAPSAIGLGTVTGQDIDFLFSDALSAEETDRQGRALYGRIFSSPEGGNILERSADFLAYIGSRLSLNQSIEQTCRYTWKTLNTAFISIDTTVQPILNDPRYALGQGGRMLSNIVLAIIAREFLLIRALTACHHYLRSRKQDLQDLYKESKREVHAALKRIARHCVMLEPITSRVRMQTPWPYLAFHQDMVFISQLPHEDLEQWTMDSPEDAAVVVRALRLNSFVSASTAHFVLQLEGFLANRPRQLAAARALVNATVREITETPHFVNDEGISAGAIVDAALLDVGTNSNALVNGNTSARRMVNAALLDIAERSLV